MTKIKNIIKVLIIALIAIPTVCYAVPEKPPGEVGGVNQGSVTYSGATVIKTDTEVSEETYESKTGGQNALLVSGGTSTLNICKIKKTGDSEGDNSDFYGTNAGILVYNGATLNIDGGSVTTDGSHANAIFAYGTGTINISDTKIKTTGNNSGALMVTGGGTLNANNITAETDGNSSAPIRSDRGGGTLTVRGGKFTSNGVGSPVIYSTADIEVTNAELISTASEGVVIEGANSISLEDSVLTATNNKLNGNSETYKSIFIYQSMSGDATEGTAGFIARNSKITNNKGDVIFVTNTNAVILLENNEIINNDKYGVFLRAATSKWGDPESNGGNVILNLISQTANGEIVIDGISSLSMTMDSSVLVGAINVANQPSEIAIALTKDSVISLTSDTYISTLDNEDTTNSNIYSNGYKLYVGEKEVSINQGKYVPATVEENTSKGNSNIIYYIIGGVVVVALITVAVVTILLRKRRNGLV